jgi:hypothetical protein
MIQTLEDNLPVELILVVGFGVAVTVTTLATKETVLLGDDDSVLVLVVALATEMAALLEDDVVDVRTLVTTLTTVVCTTVAIA